MVGRLCLVLLEALFLTCASPGIAPYNGVVAVTQNSRALTPAEHAADRAYSIAQRRCEIVAEKCRSTAPIRIDCRRREAGGTIFLFDVNMKPVSMDSDVQIIDQLILTTTECNGSGETRSGSASVAYDNSGQCHWMELSRAYCEYSPAGPARRGCDAQLDRV